MATNYKNILENMFWRMLEDWETESGLSIKYDEIEDIHVGFVEYLKEKFIFSTAEWTEIEALVYSIIEEYKYGAFEELV